MKARLGCIIAAASLLLCACSKLEKGLESTEEGRCGVCHAAPPEDRIHAAHVQGRGYECGFCHQGYALPPGGEAVVPDSLHMNGSVDVIFSSGRFPLGEAVYDAAAGRCSSVYCHGFFSGGDSATVSVRAGVSARDCGNCHNLNLMETQGHLPHMPDNVTVGLAGLVAACGACHDGYSLADSTVNSVNHIDGISGPVDPARCTVCHASLPPSHTASWTQCVSCHVR